MEDFFKFCGLLRISELYLFSIFILNISSFTFGVFKAKWFKNELILVFPSTEQIKHESGFYFAHFLFSSFLCLRFSAKKVVTRFGIKDHPYIMSLHFWTFFNPPTHFTSAYLALIFSKNCHLYDPITQPTQSLCWRNIGMIPKDEFVLKIGTRY